VFASVAAAIQSHAESNGGKPAIHFGSESISYAEFWQRVVCAMHTLQTLGIQTGDRVAYLGLNSPAELVLLVALSRLNAIFLPLNYRLATAELATIAAHAGVTLLVYADAHDDASHRLNKAVAPIKRARAAMFFDDSAQAVGAPVVPQDPSTPTLLVYTSGTTGQPKGALHTHAGLVANCIISADAHDLKASDHVLTALPLFHVGGLCIQTLPALYVGATVTLHARFDAGAWLQDVARLKPTVSLLVPATLRAVLAHPDFAATDLSSLKLINAGSSTIADNLIAPFHARGVPVCQVYGATETGPVSIYLKRADAVARTGSAGQPGPGIDVRLVDEHGHGIAAGSVGELLIRGSNMMHGYWQDPHNPSFADGWFHTGDLAWVDADGFYWVVGRSKDMIISGGENIYPAEIENLLASCADIEECAVIGQPDAQWGEVAVAVLVVKPGSTLTALEVMALFDGKLARFKQPKKVFFVDSLPKTATGKVQKAKVVAHIAALATTR
jgi:fatty-acyl-CoA synthase